MIWTCSWFEILKSTGMETATGGATQDCHGKAICPMEWVSVQGAKCSTISRSIHLYEEKLGAAK